jgi:hypothetical protein
MTFPDAAGQPCDALSDCQRSLADEDFPSFSPVPSGSARRESDYYERYISSAAWQTSPARLAELRAAGRRGRLCFASARRRGSRCIIAPTATSAANLLTTSPPFVTIATWT